MTPIHWTLLWKLASHLFVLAFFHPAWNAAYQTHYTRIFFLHFLACALENIISIACIDLQHAKPSGKPWQSWHMHAVLHAKISPSKQMLWWYINLDLFQSTWRSSELISTDSSQNLLQRLFHRPLYIVTFIIT